MNFHQYLDSPTDRYKIMKPLGQGASGSVYLVESQHTNQLFAVKKVPKQLKSERAIVEKMITLLSNAKFVVRFYEVFEDPTDSYHFYARMEYCNSNSLYQEIYDIGTTFTEEQVINIAKDIGKGIEELHKLNIIHRDIKPENIVGITSERGTKTYKLCDLGISKQITTDRSSMMTQAIGTPYYIAPEMIGSGRNTGKDYDEKVDIWAFGCVLYEMHKKETMFEGSSMEDLKTKITQTTPQAIQQQIKEFKNIQFKELLCKMITDREYRISITEVLKQLDIIKPIRKIKLLNPNQQTKTENEPNQQQITSQHMKEELGQQIKEDYGYQMKEEQQKSYNKQGQPQDNSGQIQNYQLLQFNNGTYNQLEQKQQNFDYQPNNPQGINQSQHDRGQDYSGQNSNQLQQSQNFSANKINETQSKSIPTKGPIQSFPQPLNFQQQQEQKTKEFVEKSQRIAEQMKFNHEMTLNFQKHMSNFNESDSDFKTGLSNYLDNLDKKLKSFKT